jgi:hypothetical protein
MLYYIRYSIVPGPLLSKLEPDEYALVDYWTGSCQHYQNYLMIFRGNSVSTATVELIADASNAPPVLIPKNVEISTDQLKHLDSYVHANRTRYLKTGWSTDWRQFTMRWFRRGRLTRTESYTDSVPSDFYGEGGQFSFEDLARPESSNNLAENPGIDEQNDTIK